MAAVTPVDEHLSMLLSCYLDGGLTPLELDEVVFALESDEAAIAEFRRLQEIRRTMRTLPMLDMPLHLIPGEHLGDQISAYLDGELATLEMPAVTTHLDTCADCRRELAELDKSRTAVRALPGLETPAFLDLARAEKTQRTRGVRAAVAVVSGVAAVTLAFTIGPLSSETEPSAVSISDLQSRHTAIASVPPTGTAVQVVNSP
jgi:anti-sigma factor RsiW